MQILPQRRLSGLFRRPCEFVFMDVLKVSRTPRIQLFYVFYGHKNKLMPTGQRGFKIKESVGCPEKIWQQGARTRWTTAVDREIP